MSSLISRGPFGIEAAPSQDGHKLTDDGDTQNRPFKRRPIHKYSSTRPSQSSRLKLADTHGVNTTGWDVLAKVQLGHLFFKERSLRLPTATLPFRNLKVSERRLRALILALIAAFMLCLVLARPPT